MVRPATIFGLFAILLMAPIAWATTQSTPSSVMQTEAPNWCQNAAQYLTREGRPFSCKGPVPRCIRMNNYGCIQNRGAPYPGQLTDAQGRGIVDPQFHALFEHPKWSLQRAIRTLYNYAGTGSTTPLQIASRWAPWCDTNGSQPLKNGYGRTCPGKGRAPTSHPGPFCQAPQANTSRPANYCNSCNCPDSIAAFYAEGVSGAEPNTQLQIFAAEGKPTVQAPGFLMRVIQMETGYRPSLELVNEALDVWRP